MNTQAMAEAVAEGLREAGREVDLFDTNDGRFDVAQFPSYDCPLPGIYDVAFGSPDYCSYVAGNLKQFMDDHYIADVRKGMQGLKDKPYALFYSHGGGGRVIDAMKQIFRRVGTLIGEPVGSRGYPAPDVLGKCRALGKMLGDAVSR
ncbi:MAG: hypothetical protein ISS56_06905 [Anaerolineae bacterium]|nr:hypothetical protein [Anaerolineae bacterium]